MMTKTKLACCVLVLLSVSNTVGIAQSKVHRLNFPHGRCTVAVKGIWYPGSTSDYSVRARAGQTMTIKVVSPKRPAVDDAPNNASVSVTMPSGEPLGEAGNRWTSKLPENGDYTVSVISDKGAQKFTLTVTVQ